MTDRHSTQPRFCHVDPGVFGKRRAGVKREDHASVHVDEDNCAILELLADDALGRQVQAIAIERQRRRKIVYGQGDDFEVGFHRCSCIHLMLGIDPREGRPKRQTGKLKEVTSS